MMHHFLRECWRMRWMVILPCAVLVLRGVQILPDISPLTLLLYKPSLAAVGFVAAHIGYQQAFPYLNQQGLLRETFLAPDAASRQQASILFLGTAILRGGIYAACILGVTLGL